MVVVLALSPQRSSPRLHKADTIALPEIPSKDTVQIPTTPRRGRRPLSRQVLEKNTFTAIASQNDPPKSTDLVQIDSNTSHVEFSFTKTVSNITVEKLDHVKHETQTVSTEETKDVYDVVKDDSTASTIRKHEHSENKTVNKSFTKEFTKEESIVTEEFDISSPNCLDVAHSSSLFLESETSTPRQQVTTKNSPAVTPASVREGSAKNVPNTAYTELQTYNADEPNVYADLQNFDPEEMTDCNVSNDYSLNRSFNLDTALDIHMQELDASDTCGIINDATAEQRIDEKPQISPKAAGNVEVISISDSGESGNGATDGCESPSEASSDGSFSARTSSYQSQSDFSEDSVAVDVFEKNLTTIVEEDESYTEEEHSDDKSTEDAELSHTDVVEIETGLRTTKSDTSDNPVEEVLEKKDPENFSSLQEVTEASDSAENDNLGKIGDVAIIVSLHSETSETKNDGSKEAHDDDSNSSLASVETLDLRIEEDDNMEEAITEETVAEQLITGKQINYKII